MADPIRQGFEHRKDINLEAYVNTLSLQGELVFKDPVPTIASLPTVDNVTDDHRVVLADGFVRKRDGTAWVYPTANAGAGDTNYKGRYDSDVELLNAFPIGQAGWYATVGSTDTIWVWSVDTTVWVDTNTSSYSDIQQFAGSPLGVVVPMKYPWFGRDTVNNNLYISFGPSSSDRAGPIDYLVPVS